MEAGNVELVQIIIHLPKQVLEKIRKDIQGSAFRNEADFIESLVLQKFPGAQTEIYSEDEKGLIQARLKRLGYVE